MKYKVIGLICIAWTCSLISESMIVLFLRPYPTFFPQEHAQKLSNKIAKPGTIARKQYKHAHKGPSVAGVPAVYGGLSTISDTDGLIQFPLLHAKPEITLIITTRLTPIVMASNTIHHWELEEGTPAEAYLIKHEEDQINKIFSVIVEKTLLPENRLLRPETLIIIARPKDFYVPVGATLAQPSPHFLIPDIYIKKNPDITLPLYILQLTHYFGSLTGQYKPEQTKYLRQLIR